MNGLSIPLFKNLLGAAAYGQYTLYFNALLIANLLASGWLSQAILRFYAKSNNKSLFARQVLQLAFFVGGVIFFPSALIVWKISQSWITGFLFGVLLWLAALQLPLQSLAQSSFLSKVASMAEALRTVCWLGCGLLFIRLKLPFLPALLTAIVLSYLLSVIYLYKKIGLGKPFQLIKGERLSVDFYKYGWPFSLWFILYYLSGYIDKIFLLKYNGSYVQGNYSAIYDFVTKSAGLVLAPVITAAVPLLTEAFEKKEFLIVRKLIRKLVAIEFVALIILLAAYVIGGYKILFWLLHIPNEKIYIQSGLLLTVGAMLWQIALLMQKTQELHYKSISLLIKVVLAVALQITLYLIFPFYSPLIYPIGFCLAAFIYLLSVGITVVNKQKKDTLL